MAQPAPWRVRVRATGPGETTVYARRRSFTVGSPLPFDVEEERITAFEYVLGALGADLVGGLRALARRRRLELDEIEATVEAVLENPLVHLGVVGEEGSPALERLTIRLYVSTLEPEDLVEAAWEETLRRSPLHSTLARAAQVVATVSVTA